MTHNIQCVKRTIQLLGIFSIALVLFAFQDSAFAATKTYDGGGVGDLMSTAENWDADTLPTAGDLLVFDGTSGNDATWDSSFPSANTWELNLASGYTGTLTITSSTVTVASTTISAGTLALGSNTFRTTGDMVISGGIFSVTTDAGTLDINDDFVLSSGTFTPGAVTTVEGDWTVAGGSFSTAGHDWSLTFDKTDNAQVVTTGGSSYTYDDVVANNTEGVNNNQVSFVGDLTVAGDLTVTEGSVSCSGHYDIGGNLTINDHSAANFHIANAKDLNLEGDLLIMGAGDLTYGGGAEIYFDGSGCNQTVSSTDAVPSIVINKSSGNFIVGSGDNGMTKLDVNGQVTITNGAFDLATNNIGLDVSGSFFSIGDDFSWGTEYIEFGIDVIYNTGTVTPGTGTVQMNGASEQQITANAAGLNFGDLVVSSTFAHMVEADGTFPITLSRLTVGTGSSFRSTVSTTVTGAITNAATITEPAGFIVKANASTIITNSSFVETNSIAYVHGDSLFFSVTDEDENSDGTAVDTLSVTVTTQNGDSETVILTETGVATELFQGSIVIANSGNPATGNASLELSGVELVTLRYVDGQDGSDIGTDTATLSGPNAGGGLVGSKILPEDASVVINGGAEQTNSREVVLDLGVDEAIEMLVSEDPKLFGTTWQSYVPQMVFLLSEDVGEKTVYVQYANKAGNRSVIVSSSIMYDPAFTQDTAPAKDALPGGGGSLPSTDDTDGDDLLDVEELLWKTDIHNPDTDGDGYNDGLEVRSGYNPLGPGKLIGPLQTPGSLVKNISSFAVYFIGEDGKRHAFPNEQVYYTWFPDFTGVHTVTDADLAAVPLGKPMTVKPGTRLVKITTDPKVYAVGTGGVLHWVKSEAVAQALYGQDWALLVSDVSDALFVTYTFGHDIGTFWYPNGSIVRQNSDVYFVEGGMWRIIRTSQARRDNGVMEEYVFQAPEGILGLLGQSITGYEFTVQFPLGSEQL